MTRSYRRTHFWADSRKQSLGAAQPCMDAGMLQGPSQKGFDIAAGMAKSSWTSANLRLIESAAA
jgi:hypothetical protein